MELWIRSQDRKYFVKVNQLEVRNDCCDKKNRYAVVAINFQNSYGYNFKPLGKYKTEERALEVLDEIHELLLIFDNKRVLTFVMPKE